MSTDQAIATSALNPLTAGRSVEGRYILSSVLGRGGMAEVWEAFDTVLRRRVAVKLFRGDPASVAEQQRQQAEISLVAALSHPNLVTVFDAGADRSCPGTPCTYLVMELVDGTTLARLLRFGTLPAADVAEVGAALASALAYVHARGIVHRDLKPANVLMSSAPRAAAGAVTAKLTDFGIARILDGARLTLTGTTVGTANYLSPEQASGADVTPASDVYSLGLVLLECITGEVAFPGHGVEAAVARLHRAPAIPQDIEMSWQGLLAAMTARDPATRPTAATVASRLRTLAGRHAGATGSSQLAPRIELAMRQARSVVPGPGASARSAGEGSAHPSLPGNVAGQPAARRRAKPLALAALLAAALTSVVVVLALRGGSSTDGSGAAPPRPYPSVSGKLGTDLRHLRDAVP